MAQMLPFVKATAMLGNLEGRAGRLDIVSAFAKILSRIGLMALAGMVAGP
jgi:hypothetical protein